MVRIFVIVAAFCSSFGVSAQAQQTEVALPYVDMSVCDLTNYKNQRDYWDKNKAFCFIKDGETHTYPFSEMGEIKLREGGEWVNQEYKEALSFRNEITVADYSKYYVRYLTIGKAKDGVIPFVVHVFFNSFGSAMTMFVLGEINQTGVKFVGYSYSQEFEKWAHRANSRKTDTHRVLPAADVVTHFLSTKWSTKIHLERK